MILRSLVVVLVALPLVVSPAVARQKVATATVTGRTVDLFDDNTWAYEAEAPSASDCQSIADGLHFCGDPSVWQYAPTPPGVLVQYKHDDLNYGEYIYEKFGSKQGLTLETMKSIAIKNAAAAANLPESQVIVVQDQAEQVGAYQGDTLVYRLVIQGIHVVFANTLLVLPDKEIQIATFSVGDDYTSKEQDLHEQFLALTKVD